MKTIHSALNRYSGMSFTARSLIRTNIGIKLREQLPRYLDRFEVIIFVDGFVVIVDVVVIMNVFVVGVRADRKSINTKCIAV